MRQNSVGEQFRRLHGYDVANANPSRGHSWSVRADLSTKTGHQYEETLQRAAHLGPREARFAEKRNASVVVSQLYGL